jgi:hypothetical protein
MPMENADKAALRLAIGMGLSVAIAWGAGLEAAFMAPVMTMTLLCKPGPPIPLVKGAVLGLVVAALLLAGVLTVPILEHYPVTGVLLTGALFYTVTYTSARKANPLTLFMHVALVFIPTAGVADQAATTVLARTTGVAHVIGVLGSHNTHPVFTDATGPAEVAAAPLGAGPEAASWIALQATLIVIPVFMLALSNPAFYLQGVMKTVGMGQQAGATTARTAGRELAGSSSTTAPNASNVRVCPSPQATPWRSVLARLDSRATSVATAARWSASSACCMPNTSPIASTASELTDLSPPCCPSGS